MVPGRNAALCRAATQTTTQIGRFIVNRRSEILSRANHGSAIKEIAWTHF